MSERARSRGKKTDQCTHCALLHLPVKSLVNCVHTFLLKVLMLFNITWIWSKWEKRLTKNLKMRDKNKTKEMWFAKVWEGGDKKRWQRWRYSAHPENKEPILTLVSQTKDIAASAAEKCFAFFLQIFVFFIYFFLHIRLLETPCPSVRSSVTKFAASYTHAPYTHAV